MWTSIRWAVDSIVFSKPVHGNLCDCYRFGFTTEECVFSLRFAAVPSYSSLPKGENLSSVVPHGSQRGPKALLVFPVQGVLYASVGCGSPAQEFNKAWSHIQQRCPLLLLSAAVTMAPCSRLLTHEISYLTKLFSIIWQTWKMYVFNSNVLNLASVWLCC